MPNEDSVAETEVKTTEAATVAAPTKAAPVDLFALDLRPGADAGAEMELLHPVTASSLGVFLHVLGSDSPAFRGRMRAVRDRVAAATQAEPKDEESQIILRLSRSTACMVTGWRTGSEPTVRVNGADLPYSEDACLMLVSKASWIIDQVSAFHNARANFFKP